MTETAHTRTISGMLEVFADGGSRGNPGHAAYAFIVKKDDQIIKEGKGYIGITTNNVAEYTALIEALKWLSNNYAAQKLQISLDSLSCPHEYGTLFCIIRAAPPPKTVT